MLSFLFSYLIKLLSVSGNSLHKATQNIENATILPIPKTGFLRVLLESFVIRTTWLSAARIGNVEVWCARVSFRHIVRPFSLTRGIAVNIGMVLLRYCDIVVSSNWYKMRPQYSLFTGLGLEWSRGQICRSWSWTVRSWSCF